jgi:polysaccharide pyruvyl transferase WcaK-like protein
MKRIGILTYFGYDSNLGTFLQAYCTLKNLEQVFPDADIRLINYQLVRCKFTIGKRHLVNPYLFWKDYAFYSQFRKIEKKCFHTWGEELISLDYSHINEYIRQMDLDLITVGADTILQFLPMHRKINQVPAFWLSPQIRSKKVLCSASCGGLDFQSIDEKTKDQLRRSIEGYALLGVRDDATYQLISDLNPSNAAMLQMVPDPTILHRIDYTPVEEWLRRNKISLKEPTVAINLPQSHPCYRRLIDYYRDKGYKVASLAYQGSGVDYSFRRLNPFEWTGIHKYFKLIITDRFHGTMYALKNGTPVLALDLMPIKVTHRGFSKTYSLLKMFDMQQTNHITMDQSNNFDHIVARAEKIEKEFNREHVQNRCQKLADELRSFLQKLKPLLDETIQ